MLLVREQDVPRVRELFEDQWSSMLEAEGIGGGLGCEPEDGSEPPCPACGTAAPLVGGACSDCGLQLA